MKLSLFAIATVALVAGCKSENGSTESAEFASAQALVAKISELTNQGQFLKATDLLRSVDINKLVDRQFESKPIYFEIGGVALLRPGLDIEFVSNLTRESTIYIPGTSDAPPPGIPPMYQRVAYSFAKEFNERMKQQSDEKE